MTAPAQWLGRLFTTMGILLALAGCGGDGSAPPDNGGGGGGGGGGGTPVGDPVSATIGAAGGTLATPDGGFTLTVPAGALAAATELTVQQVVNEAPYGVGKSYRLSPANVTFAEPVEISIAVDSAELGELLPQGLVVGLEDGAGDWFAKLKSGVRPEAIRTSAGRAPSVAYARRGTRIGTFTEFDGIDSNQWRRIAIVAFWVVEPTRARVRVGETQSLRVLVCTRNELLDLGGVGEDDLAPLPGGRTLPSPRPPQGCAPSVRDGFWYVNSVNGGNSVAGTVTAGSPTSTATFRAPATVPNPATVTVSAEMTWSRNGDKVDFDIPIEIYSDGWQGTIDWRAEGDSTETYSNGSLVIAYRADGKATYAPAPPGSGLSVDENGGFLRATSVSASSYYRRVLTFTINSAPCQVTTTETTVKTSGPDRFTTLPPENDPFKALWDVLLQLRDDGQYVISQGIGPVPITITETKTRTTVCPGSPPETITETTQRESFDLVVGPVNETRRFSPGDKVFKNQVTNLTEQDIEISTDVNWEFTRP